MCIEKRKCEDFFFRFQISRADYAKLKPRTAPRMTSLAHMGKVYGFWVAHFIFTDFKFEFLIFFQKNFLFCLTFFFPFFTIIFQISFQIHQCSSAIFIRGPLNLTLILKYPSQNLSWKIFSFRFFQILTKQYLYFFSYINHPPPLPQYPYPPTVTSITSYTVIFTHLILIITSQIMSYYSCLKYSIKKNFVFQKLFQTYWYWFKDSIHHAENFLHDSILRILVKYIMRKHNTFIQLLGTFVVWPRYYAERR